MVRRFRFAGVAIKSTIHVRRNLVEAFDHLAGDSLGADARRPTVVENLPSTLTSTGPPESGRMPLMSSRIVVESFICVALDIEARDGHGIAYTYRLPVQEALAPLPNRGTDPL
jgi:hypothetical protein